MDTSYLHDAFKDLNILDEEIFDISKEGSLKEAEAALAEEPDDVIDIMDMEFEDSDIEPEEDAEVETHVGDVIFDCPVCHSKLYKHPDEVELDEFEEYANVGEECPYCFTSDGFKIIGQVAPYQPEDEVSVEVEDKEEVKDSEDDSEVDDKDVNESLKKSRKIKEEFDESIWDKFSSAVKSRLNDAWNSQKSNSWFNPYFTGLVDAGVIDEKTKKIMLKSNIEDGFDDNLGESLKKLKIKKLTESEKETDRRYRTYDFGRDRLGQKIRWQDSEGIAIKDEPDLPWNYDVDGFGYFTWAHALKAADGDKSKIKKLNESKKLKESTLPDGTRYRIYDSNDYITTTIAIDDDGDDTVYVVGFNHPEQDFFEYYAGESEDKHKAEEIADQVMKLGKAAHDMDELSMILDPRSENTLHRIERKLSDLYESLKKQIKESKEVDLTEYQKWVDYDMRKYHKISKNTMSKIKKAGLSVVKDQYGEYEVIADRPDSDSESFKESKLTEKNWSYTIKSGAKLRRAIEDEDYEEIKDCLMDCYSELLNNKIIDEDDYESWTESVEMLDPDDEEAEDEFDYELNEFYDLCDNLNVWVALDESLKKSKKVHEGFEKVEVETDDQKITVKSEPKEEVPGETMLAPVSAEVKDEIKIDSESEDENSEDEVDYDISEFSEDEFDELGESYLKRVYENVESFKTTFVGQNKNNLVLEGLIKFTSGNEKKTRFVFESFDANKDGKVRFLGENQQISRGKKSFTLRGSVDGGKFIAESFNYNYKAKTPEGKSTRVYGTVKVKK